MLERPTCGLRPSLSRPVDNEDGLRGNPLPSRRHHALPAGLPCSIAGTSSRSPIHPGPTRGGLSPCLGRLVLQPEFVIFMVCWLAVGSGRHERGLAGGAAA